MRTLLPAFSLLLISTVAHADIDDDGFSDIGDPLVNETVTVTLDRAANEKNIDTQETFGLRFSGTFKHDVDSEAQTGKLSAQYLSKTAHWSLRAGGYVQRGGLFEDTSIDKISGNASIAPPFGQNVEVFTWRTGASVSRTSDPITDDATITPVWAIGARRKVHEHIWVPVDATLTIDDPLSFEAEIGGELGLAMASPSLSDLTLSLSYATGSAFEDVDLSHSGTLSVDWSHGFWSVIASAGSPLDDAALNVGLEVQYNVKFETVPTRKTVPLMASR